MARGHGDVACRRSQVSLSIAMGPLDWPDHECHTFRIGPNSEHCTARQIQWRRCKILLAQYFNIDKGMGGDITQGRAANSTLLFQSLLPRTIDWQISESVANIFPVAYGRRAERGASGSHLRHSRILTQASKLESHPALSEHISWSVTFMLLTRAVL